jgi:hypothetical protein
MVRERKREADFGGTDEDALPMSIEMFDTLWRGIR